MKNILIVGATSAIAVACARQWATEGARFFLVARNGERLKQVADDLSTRGAQLAGRHQLDINSLEHHADMLEQCVGALGTIDIVLVAPGRCRTRRPARRTRLSRYASSTPMPPPSSPC